MISVEVNVTFSEAIYSLCRMFQKAGETESGAPALQGKLVSIQTEVKNKIHSILAKNNISNSYIDFQPNNLEHLKELPDPSQVFH